MDAGSISHGIIGTEGLSAADCTGWATSNKVYKSRRRIEQDHLLYKCALDLV